MAANNERVRLDHVVTGKVGSTERVKTMRVTSIHKTFVVGVDADNGDWVMYHPEIVGPPRPVFQRD